MQVLLRWEAARGIQRKDRRETPLGSSQGTGAQLEGGSWELSQSTGGQICADLQLGPALLWFLGSLHNNK